MGVWVHRGVGLWHACIRVFLMCVWAWMHVRLDFMRACTRVWVCFVCMLMCNCVLSALCECGWAEGLLFIWNCCSCGHCTAYNWHSNSSHSPLMPVFFDFTIFFSASFLHTLPYKFFIDCLNCNNSCFICFNLSETNLSKTLTYAEINSNTL